jgi:hypothetical protein
MSVVSAQLAKKPGCPDVRFRSFLAKKAGGPQRTIAVINSIELLGPCYSLDSDHPLSGGFQ